MFLRNIQAANTGISLLLWIYNIINNSVLIKHEQSSSTFVCWSARFLPNRWLMCICVFNSNLGSLAQKYDSIRKFKIKIWYCYSYRNSLWMVISSRSRNSEWIRMTICRESEFQFVLFVELNLTINFWLSALILYKKSLPLKTFLKIINLI